MACAGGPSFGASPSINGPLNGTWKFVYSCEAATGIYADRCAEGLRDNFTLSIARNGTKVCGWYEITAQMGNHVDDGFLNDWAVTPASGQSFHVRYHLSGTSGEAVIHLSGNQLHWKNLSEHPTGENLPWSFSAPDEAILVRQPLDHPAHC
jgi:hypothetical protein